MTDSLVAAHSVLRWVVLAALVGGAGFALWQAPRERTFDRRPFALGAVAVDVQVALGAALYVLNDGAAQGLFIAVIHPVAMVAALVTVHVAAARARRQPTGGGAHRTVAAGYLLALVLVVFGVPWVRS